MSSPENKVPEIPKLPTVTRETLDRLDSKGYDKKQADNLFAESNPIAAQAIETYINGVAATLGEKVVAWEAASYLYTLLNEAQDKGQ
jgi:hypothetical protein